MVREVLRFLTAEVRGLQKAAYVLALCALLSSLLALLRDRLLAHYFGASITLDLYYAAFRIPDLIFVALGALVSVYMLIPELSKRDGESARSYLDTLIAGFSVLAIALLALAAVLAPYLLAMLFPQYVESGDLGTLTLLTRILLLQPILLGFSNILAAITQLKHRYTLYAITPLLYNAGIIFGVLVLYPALGVPGLALGVVIGALLHASVQVPSIVKDGFLLRLPLLREPQALVRTMMLSLPRALALSMNQLTILGITTLAGALASGSIAVYMFSYNLQAVPLAIIGASYSVAAFPTLALALSRGRQDEFIAHVASAARAVLFWSLPVTALAIVLRAHIVRVVLGSGAFDWTDTRLTAAAFALLALSLSAQGLTLLLVRGYYASGRTMMPLAVSSTAAALTIVFGYAMVHSVSHPGILSFLQELLRVQDVPGTAVLALAFAYAAVSILGALALLIHFEHVFSGFVRQIRRAFFESTFAALAAGAAAYLVLSIVGGVTFSSTTASVLARGFIAGAIGIIVAGIVYTLLRNRELREILDALKGRLVPSPVKAEVPIASSAEDSNPSISQ